MYIKSKYMYPPGQAHMHHNLRRANLEFRNGYSMHSSREYNSSASMSPNRSNVKHLSQQNTTSRSTESVEQTRSGEHAGQEAPLCPPLCWSNNGEIQTDLTSATKSGPAGGDSYPPASTSIPSVSDGVGVTSGLEDSVILIQDSCVPSGTSLLGQGLKRHGRQLTLTSQMMVQIHRPKLDQIPQADCCFTQFSTVFYWSLFHRIDIYSTFI